MGGQRETFMFGAITEILVAQKERVQPTTLKGGTQRLISQV